MTVTVTPQTAAKSGPVSETTERSFLTYAEKAHQLLMNQFSLRSNLEMIDRYYMREDNWSLANVRAKIANKVGNKKHIQDVTVPIVMPQVEAALGYMANVFVTGYPTFGVSSDPTQEDAALQMETIIAENSVTAGWTRQLMMFFRDGLKYNLHGLELEWQNRTVRKPQNDIKSASGVSTQPILWHGNVMRRMDLYNTFMDPRVAPSEVHINGEYAGYIQMMSRVRLLQYLRDICGDTISPALMKRTLESGPAPGGMTGSGSPFAYYVPLINPYPIMSRQNVMTFDWMAWAQNESLAMKNGVQYTNIYEVMKLYCRIIPADFGLTRVPDANFPQIWKLIIINGQVVVFAEQQSDAHNFLPIFFGQPLEDGLDWQTKSFAQNVFDMQDVASALWNGYIASKRRLVGDRVIYDPSRITEAAINSTNPAAKIPVRPTAFGKPVAEAVYAFPFRDDQTQSMLDGATRVTAFANQINGQNNATQGQFQKGNRTKFEYEDIMGHGNTHNQVMALMSEAQVFTPVKEAIKLNILQYQQKTELYNRDKQQTVQVDPISLRQAAIHFKVSDGIIPEDKEMGTDEFQTALQMIGTSPSIGAAYNIGPLFTYVMKLRGADLAPFEKSPLQLAYEQQVQQWQQVAMQAIKAGQQAPPQPQMPPALQQELQQKQQAGGANPDPKAAALQTTQGPQPPPSK